MDDSRNRRIFLDKEKNDVFQTLQVGERNVISGERSFVVDLAGATGIVETGGNISFALHIELQLFGIHAGEIDDCVDRHKEVLPLEPAESLHVRESLNAGDREGHAQLDTDVLDVEHMAQLAHLREMLVVLADKVRVFSILRSQCSPRKRWARSVRHTDTDGMLPSAIVGGTD